MSVAEQADGLKRISEKLEKAVPEEADRRAALELLAYAIENADDERATAWYLRETQQGLALYAGRLVVCRIGRGKVEMSVMGPISDDVRTALSAEPQDNDAWRAIPGGVFLAFHVEKAAAALELLKESFDKFVDEAMSRVRSRVNVEAHVREALDYVSGIVGRALPHPSPAATDDEADEEEIGTDGTTPREPKIRGRAPIFNHAQLSIASLVSDIDQKSLALPDLQRPFVWEDTKVRDLLDSIFVGFPVGTLVLWQTKDGKQGRAVGGPDSLRATKFIIDGQQRLTSLYVVMRGQDVTEKDGTKRKIAIAFRPRDGRFEVADAAIRNDPEFIANVTELWAGRMPGQIKKELLAQVRVKRPQMVDEAYESAVDANIDRAHSIQNYQFPVVTIQRTTGTENHSEKDEEDDVAEIFVRINNQGTRLGQADFVLTLLAVFHEKLRDRIEDCAIELSKNPIIELDPQQLLRASCAVGFQRARMSAIYKYLRGVDPVTGDMSPTARQSRLDTLDKAADDCIDATVWRDYLLRVAHAGVVSQGLVASNNAIVNAFALYVIGKRIGVAKPTLDALISRWVFGTLLSARYSGSSETRFEADLALIGDLKEGDTEQFKAALDNALSETITNDYWTHGVVGALETQRARAPAALAFRAAQVVLGARALFSDQPLRNLLAPPAKGKRAAGEAHHLFPVAWLQAHGVKERRRINQVANLADVGWWENNVIRAQSPADYVPRLREWLKLDDDAWGRACAEHGLPLGWEKMEYETFLLERRRRMAEVTRVAYRQLGGEADAAPIAPPWFLPNAELVWRRIVDTERALRTVVRDAYGTRYGENAATKIEEAIPEAGRETLRRALRARPAGADPLSVVDYLYLGQLPPLLFVNEVWQDARARFGGGQDAKQKLQTAIQNIMPVRNEIAHVREVTTERLQKANVACDDVLGMIASS